ncbi:MAG TPA: M23 family metallopeptidase [Puia sp.]|nr:M23 family metallopeptidase [Puia sp.]
MNQLLKMLLAFSWLCLSLQSKGQRVIEVKYVQDAQGNYDFICNNKAYCDYILDVNFTSLDNAKADQPLPYHAEVKPGSNKLFRLSKVNPANQLLFKYQVRYNKGCINPKVNQDFTYLLPVAPGKEVQAYEMQASDAPAAATGQPEKKNWYVIRLKMNPGDTIYAARRGRVTEMDVSNGLNDAGAASAGSENYIEVVHGDCSFARYGMVKKNGALVKPGQLVEAGRPLGLVGGDRYGRGSDIKLSVYYNQEQADGGLVKLYWSYIPLIFWTKYNGKGKLKHGAIFTSEHPQAIIAQELSKPVLKKPKQKPKSK